MSALPARLLNLALVAFTAAQVAGALGALFFGRKLQWLWFALAVMTFSDNVVKVALFRETDGLRSLASLAAGLLAALVAIAIHRRFTGIVIAVGGFLAAALGAVQMLGPLLNPAPEWFVFTILIAAGIAGAVWTRTNRPRPRSCSRPSSAAGCWAICSSTPWASMSPAGSRCTSSWR